MSKFISRWVSGICLLFLITQCHSALRQVSASNFWLLICKMNITRPHSSFPLRHSLLGSLVLQAQVSWWVPGTSKHPTCRQVPADSKHAIPTAQGQQWPYRQAAASRLGWQGHAGGAHPTVSSVLLWEAPSCRACRAVWEWTMYLIPPFWSSFIYLCSSPGCSHCSVSLRLFLVQTPYSLFKYKKRVCAHSCQLALETLSISFCAPVPWILSMLLD